ncbi:LOW QUALITY PROTEIN: X-box-binding protein 1 [Hypomesus transpacificus]|uniref:LOW QUALITY PROTEIN: X-box-binding protein 1 n=1 Tax=Hypomesus transpacificus TaxID=137520 RepID=UPI001F08633F|nr:LOW QUALITY PROTEIN: X-box-binding protein 1 [Hypomesus transpacificus]
MVVVTAASGGTHKVLLISGKQSVSSGATQGSFSRSISVVMPSSANQASSDSDSTSSTGPPLRKRQRLTHLSPEEKQLRRKLKNRVAAQTARDRKKAKMGELEQQVLDLEIENEKLHIENELLRDKTCDLMSENEDLRQRLGLDTLEVMDKVQVLESSGMDAGLETGSSESAVLRLRVSAAGAGPPLLPEDVPMDPAGPDAADSESDLLLGILDILDPEYFLQGGGEELQEQALLLGGGGAPVPGPALAPLGAAPVKLEALNELIHFDHIYTKPVEGVCEEGVCEESVTEVKMEEEVLVEEVVVVEVEEVEEEDDDGRSVKEETEEVDIPESQPDGSGLFSASPALCGGFDEAPCLADAYSDSGYERSPSPFSDMSSPLCPEGSWDDVFANELFPQLISV